MSHFVDGTVAGDDALRGIIGLRTLPSELSYTNFMEIAVPLGNFTAGRSDRRPANSGSNREYE